MDTFNSEFKQGPDSGSSGGGGAFSFSTSFSDINAGLFGTDVSQSGSSSGTTSTSGRISEQLQIDKEGIIKMISDVLGGDQGLAAIFGKAGASGIYNSTAAKQEAGNLLAQLAGELAKVTGTKISIKEEESGQTQDSSQNSSSPGLIDILNPFDW